MLPETITRDTVGLDSELDDLRVYDSNPLVYALVNAVKELAQRVEVLEARLADLRLDA